jgi:acyl carrier protein phosphodiesterase
LEGIDRALKGLAQRATFNSGMELAIEDLQEHYSEFKNEFMQFFPELEAHIKTVLLRT